MKKSIIKRLWVSLVLVGLGLGTIYVLPTSSEIKATMLSTELPESLNGYLSVTKEVTGEELKILAQDTEFERRSYYNKDDVTYAAIDASIVFSGKDVNNSIHRPERCLVAQGFKIEKEDFIDIEITINGKQVSIPFKMLIYSIVPKEGTRLSYVQYYTFVGHEKIVSGHYERTIEDMKGRVFGGYNQQWAYTTFSSIITDELDPQKLRDTRVEAHSIEETRDSMDKFIKLLLPQMFD